MCRVKRSFQRACWHFVTLFLFSNTCGSFLWEEIFFYINEPWANLMVNLFIETAPLVVPIFWISCLSHGCDKISDKNSTRWKGLKYWLTFPRDNPLWTGTVVRVAFAIEAGAWGSWLCFLCGQDEERDEEPPTVRFLFFWLFLFSPWDDATHFQSDNLSFSRDDYVS